MALVAFLSALASVVPFTVAAERRDLWPQSVDLERFIATERQIALQGTLNNIGPNGSMVAGAGAGFVVASPSREEPDC
jgi:hypothetical protein